MKCFALCLSLIMLFAVAAVAADQSPTVTLQYTDTDILAVLGSISQQAQASVVADSTVKGKVSLSVSGVAVADALDMICKPNKLEWYKAYAGVGAEKPSASKLFKLMDALKDLGTSALICENPTSQAQTIFVPNAGQGSVDNASIASQLKLKEIYLIRAIPDPAAIAADKAKANQGASLAGAPPNDPQAAAQQAMNWFSQMPQQQAMEAMHDLRHLVYDSMTPEQRQAYFQQFGGRGGPGGGRGGPNGGQNGGPNGQNGGQNGQNGQGGGHHHQDQGQ